MRKLIQEIHNGKNIKENLIILSLVYGIGVITGFIIEFVTKLV